MSDCDRTQPTAYRDMTTNTTTPAISPQPLVVESRLARMDEYYRQRRLPGPTPKGAKDRTYCFRVEFEHDLYPLSHMLRWAVDTWWQSPLCPWGDADVKMTLKPNTLSLPELRWLMDRVGDCHVAVETVELEADYTGERKYQSEEALEMVIPGREALRAAIAGLQDFRETLEFMDHRASSAEAEIDAALVNLRNKEAIATWRKRMSKSPVKPQTLTSPSKRNKRAAS